MPVVVDSYPATKPGGTATRSRGDLVAVGIAALLVVAAVVVRGSLPLYGVWLPHLAPASMLALLLAVAAVVWGPVLAARLPWRGLLATGYVASSAWLLFLALVDGWQRGFAGRLTTPHEYLHEVPGITDIPAMLDTFADRIVAGNPGFWTTHVAGHPPGATLVFVWLDRLGLSGGVWAAFACVLAGALVSVAVPVTLAALGRADAARACWPFVVLFPGAVWLAVSADAIFAGITACGIALLARAIHAFRSGARHAPVLAAGAGVVLGFGVFLSYGLVLLGVVALAVVALGRGVRALLYAIAGAAAVVVAFALAGFWWFHGYQQVIERYHQGIAAERPYSYWVWANLACLVLAVGPAVVAGLRRAWGSRAWTPAVVLTAAALCAVLIADLSGLSKAEVERIWLPFAVWLLPATALLPPGSRRWWLAGQAATALAVNHLMLTVW